MNKKESQQLTTEVLLTDILVRLTTLENLLFSKGAVSVEEFKLEMEKLHKQLAKSILQDAGKNSNEIDDIIKSLSVVPSKDQN